MHNKTWLPLTACLASITVWFIFILIIGVIPAGDSLGTPYFIRDGFTKMFGNTLSWWAVVIIGIFIVVGINLGATAIQRVYFPTDRNLWQEIEQKGEVERVAREYYESAEARDKTNGGPKDAGEVEKKQTSREVGV